MFSGFEWLFPFFLSQILMNAEQCQESVRTVDVEIQLVASGAVVNQDTRSAQLEITAGVPTSA